METVDGIVFPAFTLWIMYAVIYFFLISLFALFIGLGLHKRRVLRLARQRIERIEDNRSRLAAIAAGEPLQLGPIRNFEQAACLAEAFRDQPFKGDALEFAVREALVRTGIEGVLRTALVSRDWGHRYRCMNAIHDLGWPLFFDILIGHAKREENLRVYGNCLYACSNSMNKVDDFPRLLATMESRPELSASFAEGIFRSVIRSMLGFGTTEDVHKTLAQCLQRENPSRAHQVALIAAIGKEQVKALAGEIVDYARATADAIVTASAMRALHAMGRCDNLILGNLSSGDRTVQIAAIRSCRHCGEGIERRIAQLLSSPSFDVRYASAMTLRSMGGDGQRLLYEARNGQADPYARNMAAFALALE